MEHLIVIQEQTTKRFLSITSTLELPLFGSLASAQVFRSTTQALAMLAILNENLKKNDFVIRFVKYSS